MCFCARSQLADHRIAGCIRGVHDAPAGVAALAGQMQVIRTAVIDRRELHALVDQPADCPRRLCRRRSRRFPSCTARHPRCACQLRAVRGSLQGRWPLRCRPGPRRSSFPQRVACAARRRTDPDSARRRAAARPPSPPPMTSTSNGVAGVMKLGVRPFSRGRRCGRPPACAPVHSLARAAISAGTSIAGLKRLQGSQDARQGDALHVRAQVAGLDELHIGKLDGDVAGHRALGDHRHLLRVHFRHVLDHRRGRADIIGLLQDVIGALRMGHDVDAGVHAAELPQLGTGEALVHLAGTCPHHQFDLGLAGDVLPQKLVGNEDHLVDAQRLDHLHGVGRGAADVRFRLDLRRGVDVRHNRQAGVTGAEGAHIGTGDRGCQGAAGTQVRQQHGLSPG
jgi:hypothetical protein